MARAGPSHRQWLQQNVAWGSSLCPAKWLIFLQPQTVAGCSVKDNINVVPAPLQIIYLAQGMDAIGPLGKIVQCEPLVSSPSWCFLLI